MKQRGFLIGTDLSGLLLAATLLAGCGSGGGSAADDAGAGDRDITQKSQTFALQAVTGTPYMGGEAKSARYRIVYQPAMEEVTP